MNCFMCKGTVRDGFSVFTADMDGRIIVIKNVPSGICDQCGEISYNDEVAKRLEQIIQSIINTAVAEIAIISYSEKAA